MLIPNHPERRATLGAGLGRPRGSRRFGVVRARRLLRSLHRYRRRARHPPRGAGRDAGPATAPSAPAAPAGRGTPPTRVDALGGWARRFFAPMLTAGAAIAIVGLVGTTAPSLSGMTDTLFSNVSENLEGGAPAPEASDSRALSAGEAAAEPSAEAGPATNDAAGEEPDEFSHFSPRRSPRQTKTAAAMLSDSSSPTIDRSGRCSSSLASRS